MSAKEHGEAGGSAREVDRAGAPTELSVGGRWRSSRQRRGGRGGGLHLRQVLLEKNEKERTGRKVK
jgi:hypothetical protein